MPEGSLARGAGGLAAGWAGQSGVLGVVIAVAGPGLLGHPTSTSDLGVNQNNYCWLQSQLC